MSAGRLGVIGVIVGLGLATGCTEVEPYLPKVRFERLDVRAVDWEHVEADFVFAVNNPNPVDISLARFDYALAFEGIDFLDGDDPDGLVLVGEGDSELSLPTNIEFQGLYDMVQATRGQDAIGFGLTGSFGFDTPAGPLDLPYEADGDFPALRAPEVGFQGARVKSMDWSGARVDVDLGIDNDHGSTLTFQNFDYLLSLEGSPLASGLVDLLGSAEGAQTSTVTLPIEVDFAEAGAGAYEAFASGGKVQLALGASSDVDTPFGVVQLAIDESGKVSIE